MTKMQLAAMAALAAAAAPAIAQNRIDQIRPDAPELAPYGNYAIGVRAVTFSRTDVPNIAQVIADADAEAAAVAAASLAAEAAAKQATDDTAATAVAKDGATDDAPAPAPTVDTASDTAAGQLPSYDRSITVEVWYPAAPGTVPGGSYATVLRDGATEVQLTGRAARDAAPATEGSFPLVIVSHGYPGNRFLLAPLAENLASKGYVVASIDHPDSTYSDLGAFGSTLVNRPQDQAFVLDEMTALDGDLGKIIDDETAAVIGYSMGGYGALIFSGAGLSETGLASRYAPPHDVLAVNGAGSDSLAALPDPRVKAVVAVAPWGRNRDLWDAEGLAAIDKPLLLIAGSVDDVSGYDAIRQIFEETTGTTRHLLTFENANHNAAAPMPAPVESWVPSASLGYPPFDHYGDPVWDSVRMNNITQHFVTAFLDRQLKGEADKGRFLDLLPRSADGVWARDEDGVLSPEDSYWTGFANRTAVGLRFETLPAGE